ncbi:unnamed protein product [Calicophoron daubneyi]|uniref:ZSWIM3 N-terminal domain-containing protein n=1 Tax=Calicophoron daubneyi TaxID=300641 RepID=A0AAV2TAL0_CALDB
MLCDISKAFGDYFAEKSFDSYEEADKHIRIFQKCTDTLYVKDPAQNGVDSEDRPTRFVCFMNVMQPSKIKHLSPPHTKCPASFHLQLKNGVFTITSFYIVHNHDIEDPGYLLEDKSDMLTPSEVKQIESILRDDDESVRKFVAEVLKKKISDIDVANLRRNYDEDMNDSCTHEQRRLCLSSDLFILGLPAWDISEQFKKYLDGKLFDSYGAFIKNLKKFEEETGSIYVLKDSKKIVPNEANADQAERLLYKTALFRCTNPKSPPEPTKAGGSRPADCKAYLKLGMKFNKLCIIGMNNQHSHFFYPRGRLLRQTNIRCAPKRPSAQPPPASLAPPPPPPPPPPPKVAPPPEPEIVVPSPNLVVPITPLPDEDVRPKETAVPYVSPLTGHPLQLIPVQIQQPDRKSRFAELCPYLRLLALLVEADEDKYISRKRLLLSLIEAWTNEQKVDLFVHQLSHSSN